MAGHSIQGKTVLIAGGAKNLGGLIARDLAQHGAQAIAIHYNSAASAADANKTAAAIEAAGARAIALQADLTSAAAVEKLFADTVAAIGRPDIAINTVGKVLKKPMIEISEAEYDEMTAVNSKTAFFFLREAGRNVKDNGKVCTIVTSLLGAYTPFYAAYGGTKSPVEHFTRAASKEFGERGISVTAVGPGPMDTPFFYPAEGADAEDIEQWFHSQQRQISGRLDIDVPSRIARRLIAPALPGLLRRHPRLQMRLGSTDRAKNTAAGIDFRFRAAAHPPALRFVSLCDTLDRDQKFQA
jgi:NAD(P)-dependent dehydrogenase (short-subunit alcohol dehydrogenase family)